MKLEEDKEDETEKAETTEKAEEEADFDRYEDQAELENV